MSAFNYALAGGLQGLGEGLKANAVAKRESALENLRHQRLLDRDQANRDFQTTERLAAQDFTATQNAAKLEVDREIAGVKAAATAEGDKVKDETALRKEYEGLNPTKEFDKLNANYGRIRASVDKPSASGDIALIFSFMKMLDPQSTVREGEFATAEQAGGVPARVLNLYNSVVNGERLAPEVRKDLVTRAEKLFSTATETMATVNERYEGLASQYGYDPSRVVRALPTFEPIQWDDSPEDVPPVPEGVNPELWKTMPPDMRQRYIKAGGQ